MISSVMRRQACIGTSRTGSCPAALRDNLVETMENDAQVLRKLRKLFALGRVPRSGRPNGCASGSISTTRE